MSETESGDLSQGWDAIDHALQTVYGDQKPEHFGAIIKYRFGGPDPLDGISIYRSDAAGRPHWHYVTYGLSDLYGERDNNDPPSDDKVSGYGFELTFRLAVQNGETEPPTWALSFLQNLARYVFETGNTFAAGHWMSANGPIEAGSDTLLTEMGLVEDPQLRTIQTPYGKLQFLQVVGLTADELYAIRRWNVRGALAAMQAHMPLWITDTTRPSLHTQPDVHAAISEGAAKDGSSTGSLYVDHLHIEQRKRLLRSTQTIIHMGTLSVRDLKFVLPWRLPHGKPFVIFSDTGAGLEFMPAQPGQSFSMEGQGTQELTLTINEAQMQALLHGLRAREGEYTIPGIDNVIWQVKTSIITNNQGEVTGKYEE